MIPVHSSAMDHTSASGIPPPPPPPGMSISTRETVEATKAKLEKLQLPFPLNAPTVSGLGDEDDTLRSSLKGGKHPAARVSPPAPPPKPLSISVPSQPARPEILRPSPTDSSGSSTGEPCGKASLLAVLGGHPSLFNYYVHIEDKSSDFWRGAISMFHASMETHAAERGRMLDETLAGLTHEMEDTAVGLKHLSQMMSKNQDIMKQVADDITKATSSLKGSIAMTVSPVLAREAIPRSTLPSALPAPFFARKRATAEGGPIAGTLRAQIDCPEVRNALTLLNLAPQPAISSFAAWAPHDIVEVVARLRPSLNGEGALLVFNELKASVPQKPGSWTLK
ncbi:ORF4 protein [IRE/CTVM19-associated rhabdovirus]|nr:ORF4 protein [IRE/CTVM19-associated rhabdovirus]UZH98566.1 putative protein ORF4 [IRE/CTVM19-associated rhabdovirus]